jgi:SAM-dependent methyltransferase
MQNGDLTDLQQVWDTLARTDPLWAILSRPDKRGGKWAPEEFFRSGQVEVDRALGKLLTSGCPLAGSAALDFGCGVGRLTQPLADYFQRVVGVDISPAMLDLARQFNRRGCRVEYVHNAADNLRIFADAAFDLVYSKIVLQHMPPPCSTAYIREFFRITRPGGFIMFQVPSHLTEEYLPHSETEGCFPETACHAGYRLVSGPTTLAPGETATWQVEVTNTSSEAWLQQKRLQLNLGNHWLLQDSRAVLVNDDGRSRLPGKLPPGEKTVIALNGRAPATPGEYVLELDLVQEGCRWFKDAGSPTLLVSVQVTGRPTATAENTTDAAAAVSTTAVGEAMPFMMEGVRKDEVLALISEANARLIDIEEDVTEWYSYAYYIVR